jgi:hypothetical protein
MRGRKQKTKKRQNRRENSFLCEKSMISALAMPRRKVHQTFADTSSSAG